MPSNDREENVYSIKNGPISLMRDDSPNDFGQAAIQIEFSDKAVLGAWYWRFICDGKAALSSFDHQQKYGLPSPIDAIEQLQDALNNSFLESVQLDRETGDLSLSFKENRKLQVFNFSGYEVWSIHFPDGAQEFSNCVLQR